MIGMAARVAAACGLEHHLLRLGPDFFSDFAAHADKTVFVTDGCSGILGAHEIYLHRLARPLAPVRLTGNYGSEIFRGVSTFKPLGLAPQIFDPDFLPAINATAGQLAALEQAYRTRSPLSKRCRSICLATWPRAGHKSPFARPISTTNSSRWLINVRPISRNRLCPPSGWSRRAARRLTGFRLTAVSSATVQTRKFSCAAFSPKSHSSWIIAATPVCRAALGCWIRYSSPSRPGHCRPAQIFEIQHLVPRRARAVRHRANGRRAKVHERLLEPEDLGTSDATTSGRQKRFPVGDQRRADIGSGGPALVPRASAQARRPGEPGGATSDFQRGCTMRFSSRIENGQAVEARNTSCPHIRRLDLPSLPRPCKLGPSQGNFDAK